MIGRTISHYRIVAPLGSGGMGVVYRAEDVRLGREVAVKFVSEDLADDEQAVQRLRSEARAASALNHSNICTIYDVGEVDGHPFIVMELLKGLTLRERLQSGPVKVSQLLDIGIEVADALHTAHTNGIIHRDIKPGNILITERGHVKILDFGLAKLTAAFSGASAVTFEAILNKAPIAPISLNPDLTLRLQEVINNCLEKDRELRYQSAADLRADLKRVRRDIESSHSRTVQVATADRVRSGQPTLSGRIDPAASEPVTAKLPPDASVVRISRMQLAAGIGVLLLVVGFGVYALWNRSPAVSQESTRTIPAAAATIEEPLRLAVASLAARNYRAAANYADQVLAIDPGNSEAKRIQAESRVIMARFDAAIDDAREHLSAGDTQGAAAALDRAREIDPGSPVVLELGSRLADEMRRRQLTDRASQRAAAAPPPDQRQAREAARRNDRVAALPPPTSLPSAQPPPTPSTAVAAVPTPAPTATSVPAQVSPPEPPSAPTPPKPAAPPPSRAEPKEPPSATEQRENERKAAAGSAEQDEAAIRRVMTTYARAIETKDLALFRSIKPNLSREEERRLQEGFKAVTSQRVEVSVASIDVHGDTASVVLKRRDTIQAGGRQQTTQTQQTMRLSRAASGWVIVEIR